MTRFKPDAASSSTDVNAGEDLPLDGDGRVPRRRADAIQNRKKILDAAEFVFLKSGINASLDTVAEEAGVARTTLFRNFVDRHALIVGLLDRALEELEREAVRIDGDADALRRVLRYLVDRTISRAPLNEYWRTLGNDSPECRAALPRFLAALDKPVSWAVAGGACRSDLVTPDLLLVISMLNGTLYAHTLEQRTQLADRAWAFTVELVGLREAQAQ